MAGDTLQDSGSAGMDYHTHTPGAYGGFLCSVTREDWAKVAAAAPRMIPCFGVHPWHAQHVDPTQIAFELDDWLVRFPRAQVGESGLDASPPHAATLDAQRILLQVHLGAAFRHDRLIHLHGVAAWSEILTILRARERTRTLPRVLLHAWNGSHELAREFLALGAVFSVGLRELSHPKASSRYGRIPADRIFPESDDNPASFPQARDILSHR